MPTVSNATIYSIKGEKGTTLSLEAMNAVDYAIEMHNQHKNQATPNPTVDTLACTHMVSSAFVSTSAPDTPTTIERKKALHHTHNPLRSFIYLQAVHKTANDEAAFLDMVGSFLRKYNNPDYILYPSAKYATKRQWQLIVKLNRLVNKEQYEAIIHYMIKQLQLTPTKTLLKDLTSVTKPFPIPLYGDVAHSAHTQHQANGDALVIDDAILDLLGVKDDNSPNGSTANMQYDSAKLRDALESFALDIDTPELLADDKQRSALWASIANAIDEGTIDEEFAQDAIERLGVTDDERVEFMNEYQDIKDSLKQNPDQRMRVAPIGTFIPMYNASPNALNIAEQLLSHLGDNFIVDPKLELHDAAKLISTVYPPSIIQQPGSDKENVVIFNPLTGVWTHDEDLFYSLLTAIKPYSTVHMLDTLMRTFAAQARNANRYIKPYSGSRYLLFTNGVVDIKDMSLHDLTESFVRRQNFTERSKLNIPFVHNPPLPQIKEGRVAGGDWNPQDFISAYGNNEPERVQFFLFGLSLGLFGAHNFGVHFDIQGESRWGKTTISEIFNQLYENRTVIISFTSLNGRFPFTSYPMSTSLIWVKECNIGTDPLSDEYGTVVYDGLADNQVRFEVKSGNDIVLSNPPPVFIDGTQFIQAREINTGPAGRTLAYKLPPMTQELRDQAYASNIVESLHRVDVLQWLVYHMMEAYRAIIPANRQGDLKLNLSHAGDLDLLPEFAQSWRREFASDSTDLNQWYTEEIDPYLSTDPKKPSLMHNRILYELYSAAYLRLHPHDRHMSKAKTTDYFDRQIPGILEQAGWRVVPVGTAGNKRSKTLRKRVSTIDKLNFDWAEYEESYKRPTTLMTTDEAAGGMPNIFNTLMPGWFEIHRIP